MTPEVEQAIAEIKVYFEGHRVEVEPEAQGGAYVTVHDLWIGTQYSPPTSWIGFLIGFQYPRADIYPHFTDCNVRRSDGSPLGESFSESTAWRNRATIQVSRRSRRSDQSVDTAATKLAQVLEWIRTR
jgi:hypothetical protein